MLAGRKIFDMEQFIEYFDISLISLPLRLPEFISVYHELEVSIASTPYTSMS
jgi:hypothetical protein